VRYRPAATAGAAGKKRGRTGARRNAGSDARVATADAALSAHAAPAGTAGATVSPHLEAEMAVRTERPYPVQPGAVRADPRRAVRIDRLSRAADGFDADPLAAVDGRLRCHVRGRCKVCDSPGRGEDASRLG